MVWHGPCRCPDALPRPLMHPSHREPGRWGLGEEYKDDGGEKDGENGKRHWTRLDWTCGMCEWEDDRTGQDRTGQDRHHGTVRSLV